MSAGHAVRLGHFFTNRLLSVGSRRFAIDLGRLEQVQRAQLSRLLRLVAAVDSRIDPGWRWEDYTRRLPVTDWEYWRPLVERQRTSRHNFLIDSPIQAWRPKAGVSPAASWVPCTRRFLGELDSALAPWVSGLYQRHPGMARGPHFWLMPWLVDGLRAPGQEPLWVDGPLMSAGWRWVARCGAAVPGAVGLARTPTATQLQTLAFLAAEESLAAMFVRSPRQLIGLLELMGDRRECLARTLGQGCWSPVFEAGLLPRCPRSARASALLRAWNGLPDGAFFRELWPHLACVSAWDTASSACWAGELKRLLPHAAFEGRGLWSTEGIVSIPFEGRCVMAYRSHVVEFGDSEDGRVLAPWQLSVGQRVVPVLSTGSGLLRYRLNDVLEVGGFEGTVPVLEYVGRDDGCDLVGEKLTVALVLSITGKVCGSGMRPVSLLALDDAGSGRPGYVLLIEDDQGATRVRQALIAGILERALSKHVPYGVARNLGLLDAARVVCAPGLSRVLSESFHSSGLPQGGDGIGPLHHWKGKLPDGLASWLSRSVCDPTPPLQREMATSPQ